MHFSLAVVCMRRSVEGVCLLTPANDSMHSCTMLFGNADACEVSVRPAACLDWVSPTERLFGADPKSQDKAGTQAAVEYVSSLIQQEVAAGIPLDRIVVAGFSQARTAPPPDCTISVRGLLRDGPMRAHGCSQGGHVSLKTALAQPQPIAACVGLSTWCEQTAPVRQSSNACWFCVGICQCNNDHAVETTRLSRC